MDMAGRHRASEETIHVVRTCVAKTVDPKKAKPEDLPYLARRADTKIYSVCCGV